MTDDELIEKMVNEHARFANVRSTLGMRAAIAIARPVIERETLEKAAKVASAFEDKYQIPTEYDYGAQICSREIAAAIRALGGDNVSNS